MAAESDKNRGLAGKHTRRRQLERCNMSLSAGEEELVAIGPCRIIHIGRSSANPIYGVIAHVSDEGN